MFRINNVCFNNFNVRNFAVVFFAKNNISILKCKKFEIIITEFNKINKLLFIKNILENNYLL